MNWKYAFATLIVLVGQDFVNTQQIPSTTTAAELWNPWTWFWPYAIATSEGFRDYYQKAQKATNELYQQAYKTNAFPWLTGNWGGNPQGGQGGQSNQGGSGGQNNQGGTGGQTQGGQSNQAGTGGQTQGGTGGQTQGGQSNQGGTGGQTQGGTGGQTQGGQSNQGGTGGQTGEGNTEQPTIKEEPAQTTEGSDSQTEKPVQEEEAQTEASGAQIQGSVSDDGTGNAEVNGTL